MRQRRKEYKNKLRELVEEDEGLSVGESHEIIYKIDDINVYGEFYDGIRSIDHNFLRLDDVSWEELIEWGTVVVPETQTYISDAIMPEFEILGYNSLPTGSNHLVGHKESKCKKSIEYER
ncbi:hypothetical protein P9B03_02040 [Metasolibacillus meyeri]|uniref:Uncharacterized protein n=1 Tax=Metasolibacillus meyeri TaxID=1071052 RepID=A0AAW9NR41_9BACL|nr:hypothetical protein [Metasolibacillus meyeri]MEC1177251.1 hypothetical protein [Metasolibacillus meyeri]